MTCGYDPSTCLKCGGRIIYVVKMARDFDKKEKYWLDEKNTSQV